MAISVFISNLVTKHFMFVSKKKEVQLRFTAQCSLLSSQKMPEYTMVKQKLELSMQEKAEFER